MEKLFGIPMEDLVVGLTVALFMGLALFALAAWRNRVLFRVGVRNIARRPAQTALIVLGLMLATLLVSAALVTGDTMKYSIQTSAVAALGQTDLIVQPKSQEEAGLAAADTGDAYIQPRLYEQIEARLDKSSLTDGVTPALRINVPAASPQSQRNVPTMQLMGLTDDYASSFDPLQAERGRLSIANLEADQAYLNREATEKLEVKTGDEIEVFAKTGPEVIEVAGVYIDGGRPAVGPAMVMGLGAAQEVLQTGDGFNAILISGQGDELAGAERTEAIQKSLKSVLKDRPFEIRPLKKDNLDESKEIAAMFTNLFLVFGQFSMVAGIMLIFLIFVMLAAERKTELGVVRALGAHRRDLLKIFLFEGALYAVLAALVGSAMGVAVGWLMVKIMAGAFSNVDNLIFSFYFNPRSVLVAYAIGVITTFFVVAFSAWRVGRINIVRAIRDIPEPMKAGRSLKWLMLLVSIFLVGALVTLGGYSGGQRGTFGLGLSLLFVAVPLLARWVRLPDRAAFTIAGLGLIAVWMAPESVLNALVPGYETFEGGLELFFLAGIAGVTGAVWTVMYNSDILLSAVTVVVGRFKGLSPLLRIAVNYPMKNRVRTGLTLAMFSLVVFTLVFMSALLSSMNSVYNDMDKLTGGYDIQGSTGYANPVKSVGEALDQRGSKAIKRDVGTIGSFAMAPVEIRQSGLKKRDWNDFVLRGIDDGYAQSVNYEFHLISNEYDSDREVWQALVEKPNVAVVHVGLVPAKVSFNADAPTDQWRLSGLYREDKKLPDIYIETKSQLTGETTKLKVIGVVSEMSLGVFNGVVTSQKTLDDMMGAPIPPTVFWFKLKPGVELDRAAKSLAKVFYQNGMETELVADGILENIQINQMINRLLQGFMGLGLVVGIAALGVIAARSVVERRRQIGMIRAIGFRRGMVQNTFLMETSFIALLGTGIGLLLGLTLADKVASFIAKDMPGLVYQVPWLEIAVIAGVAYGASLLTTYLPARQAAKVYPAEALRYE